MGRLSRGAHASALLPIVFLMGALSLMATAARALGDPTDDLISARLRTLGRGEFLPGLTPPRGVSAVGASGLGDGATLYYGGGFNVNRVDGYSIHAIQEIRNRGWLPGFRSYQSYGFTSRRWSGAFETRVQPARPPMAAGVRLFDETATWALPVQPVEPEENFAASLVLREDLYDYLRRRGVLVYTEWAPSPGRGAQLAWSEERHTSLDRERARLGLFGWGRRFRPNPDVDEGTWQIVRARGMWAFGPIPRTWEAGQAHAFLAEAQTTGGALAGNRHFWRLWLEQRGRQRLTLSQFFGYRLAGGWTPRGQEIGGSRLPEQWQFQAGGVGTLRGHAFQEFRGDRLFLFTVEYGLDLGDHPQPVIFIDGGRAWNQAERRGGGIGGSGPLPLGVGAGVQLGTGAHSARLDVARDLRAERAPARVTFRFGIPY